MTIPLEYKHASRDFGAFLIEAREALGRATANQTYTTAQAVLSVFLRRLCPHEVAVSPLINASWNAAASLAASSGVAL